MTSGYGGMTSKIMVLMHFGYIPNANKCWLIVKQNALQQAKDRFRGTGGNISVEGQKHLGAHLGTRNFAEAFVRNKVQKWVNEVKCLSTIAKPNLKQLMQH